MKHLRKWVEWQVWCVSEHCPKPHVTHVFRRMSEAERQAHEFRRVVRVTYEPIRPKPRPKKRKAAK